MKRIQIAPHFSDESLKSVMNLQTDVRSFKGWQIIYFVQTNPDKSLLEISRLLGVSKSKVFITIKLYNEFGENWLTKSQWGGRREQRCHLSLEDEKQLMQSLESEALLGKILTFRHIRQHVECRVGKEVSDDYIWDLFQRHHWSKKQPRPHHPKADKEAQEEFKKNSVKIWLPKH